MSNKDIKHFLIISYYWPPSGGAGVQRWLKLSYYLAELGHKITVLTIDSEYANYGFIDTKLSSDIHPKIKVVATKAFNPFSFYEKLPGKKNNNQAGLINDDNSLKMKTIKFIRSHAFIPDPRKGWNKYAIQAAAEILNQEKIDFIVTTSPPHSTQLIGLQLKKQFKVKWLCDLRDPWTDIYYYDSIGHTFISKWIDKKYEMQVLKNADFIFTASFGIKDLAVAKSNRKDIKVLTNGYDPKDFKDLNNTPSSKKQFRIVYTGTISNLYSPQVFFQAVDELIEEKLMEKQNVEIQLIGAFDKQICNDLKNPEIVKDIGYLPHSKINQYQVDASVLLIVIPNTPKCEVIIVGKLFEYMLANRPIINIGPKNGDTARIINETQTGKTFERNEKPEIKKFLLEIYQQKFNYQPLTNEINQYSRLEQAKTLINILEKSN